MKTTRNFLLMMIVLFTLVSCNDIQVNLSFDRFQTQTDVVVRISNARPNVRLKVVAVNVPRTQNMEVYVNTDSEGRATARIEYRFLASLPTFCELTPGEKRTKGLLNVHDETNPDPDQRVSRVKEFGISPLFVRPVGGCTD